RIREGGGGSACCARRRRACTGVPPPRQSRPPPSTAGAHGGWRPLGAVLAGAAGAAGEGFVALAEPGTFLAEGSDARDVGVTGGSVGGACVHFGTRCLRARDTRVYENLRHAATAGRKSWLVYGKDGRYMKVVEIGVLCVDGRLGRRIWWCSAYPATVLGPLTKVPSVSHGRFLGCRGQLVATTHMANHGCSLPVWKRLCGQTVGQNLATLLDHAFPKPAVE
ncbi:unnamed protein product, partial [Prorocentrum cordatum]